MEENKTHIWITTR